jgi:hypothetical protein
MEKIFANGLIFKSPKENTPEFVKGHISVKVDEFTKFLEENDNNGWVNIDLKKSREGKFYFELNTWKPKGFKEKERELVEEVEKETIFNVGMKEIERDEEINVEGIPF